MLKNNPYMKAYLNVINENTDIDKYQQIAKIIGGEYIPETNTIDCKGNKVRFEDYWINEDGSFNFKLINTSNDWSFMFYDCTNLTHLPDDFTIPEGVIDCSSMFSDCKSLTHLPDDFTIPEGVINCYRMFSNCKSLTHLPNNFTIPNSVEDCSYMFNWCTSLIHLSENFTIPESVEDCSYMFYECESLSHLSNHFHVPYDVNCTGMFAWCTKLGATDPKAYMIWEM